MFPLEPCYPITLGYAHFNIAEEQEEEEEEELEREEERGRVFGAYL